jgi:MarR family transcriptional regulator for hemolysin
MGKRPLQARERFGQLIGEIHRLWRLRMNDRLRPLGLSQARWTTLRTLRRAGNAIAQTELAARVGVEAPTLVGILDGLVRSGYVVRRVAPHDRRVRTIHLTARAQRQLAKIERVATELRREATRDSSVATLRAASVALEKVRDRLVDTPARPPAARSGRGATRRTAARG